MYVCSTANTSVYSQDYIYLLYYSTISIRFYKINTDFQVYRFNLLKLLGKKRMDLMEQE